MKLECQLKHRGFLNFRPLRISDFRSSLFTIFRPPVMTFSAGLQLKCEEEQDHVEGLPFGGILEFAVIKMFRSNGPCISVKKTKQNKE